MLDSSSICHNSQNIYFRNPTGAAEAGSRVRMALWLRTGEDVKSVFLRCWQDQTGEKLVPMQEAPGKYPGNAEEHYYTAEITMPPKGCLLWYYFIVTMPDGTYFYGNNRDQLGGCGELYHEAPPSFQITVYNKGAKTPDWFKHAVMYQIFPDRFNRAGDKLIEKKGAVMHASWDDDPCYYKDPDTKEIVAYDFFGGNLKGIEEKLDDLKALGISVIYLNPVFESESNHHYDTGDYKKIDPMLGTEADFQHLVKTAKAKGIRILLDGVFSHTGSNSRYFNRKGEYDSIGAFQSPDSPYYDWYHFRNYPYEYDCWWDFNTLPDVTETTPSYMDFIINSKDSVLHHWMKDGIAGWRLDVIDELPPTFSQAFYKELKKTDPDAVMIGEVWEDASNKVAYGQQREYLCGQEMDSAMNYPFRKDVFEFLLGKVDAQLCMRRLESLRENYPKQNFYAMMNLLGSHDRARAITVLGEAPYYDGMPAIEQSRFRMNPDQYNLGMARLFLAALWQMTYPGVPSIYYGDEIGMQGFKDPYNRRPYRWQDGDTYIRDYVKKLVALRNGHAALRTGEILPLQADGDVICYARFIRGGKDVFGEKAENEAFLIAINRSRTDEKTITLEVAGFAEGELEDCLEESKSYGVRNGSVTFTLPPLKGALLRQKKQGGKYPREAGILLHPTSLPSKCGIGGLGKEAYDFVDFLAASGVKVWQMLPLGPLAFGYSPYQSPSAFAGNELLVDIDDLVKRGWLTASEAKVPYADNGSRVDYARVEAYKKTCIRKAWPKFRKSREIRSSYQDFCQKNAYWLDDYALFQAAKKEYRGEAWTRWPEKVRDREPGAIRELRSRLEESVDIVKFAQFLFYIQWRRLHDYAAEHGVKFLGDMPIFISQDSSDVWANRHLFNLNGDGTPKTVAGVPPDYFSADGQLWGNPHYRWDEMAKDGYAWWKARFRKLFELVDMVRVDHFRGFEAYWVVDAGAENARGGHWEKGPGKPFFDAVKADLGSLPIVAENLGIITDEVEQLREDCGFPGMKVLQFLLHLNSEGRTGFAAPENSVVYTGTHDNNTTVGWYTGDLNATDRTAVADLLGADPDDPKDVAAKLTAFAYQTDARLAVVPMQDILGLDGRNRMNTPGTVGSNWTWRMTPDDMKQAKGKAAWLKSLSEHYHR